MLHLQLLPLQPFTFSLSLSIALTISLHYLYLSFCSQIMSLFMGISWQTIGHQLWHKWWQHMGCTIFVKWWVQLPFDNDTLLLRVGCTIYCPLMANPNNHPLWHLNGQLSSCSISTSLHPAALPSLPFWERLWPSLQVLTKPFNHQSHQNTPLLTTKDHFNQMVSRITSEEC